MVHDLFAIAAIYTLTGLLIYDTARSTEMSKRDQIKYSVFWPWLFIVTVYCILFPED